MKAIRIHRRGGPEVLGLEEIERPVAGPGEVLIEVAVAGVNFAEVGQRGGGYSNLASLPLTLGYEVAGTIVAVGPNVPHLRAGMRVASHFEQPPISPCPCEGESWWYPPVASFIDLCHETRR